METNGLECTLDEQEIKSILEAVLFVAHDPLTLDRLTAVVEGPPKSVVSETLKILQKEYEQEGRGLRLAEVAGGFLLVTRPEYAPYIKRLNKSKSITKLSRSALETLAIISYKQPIIRADIEKIRGVETSGVLRTLLDQKLVRIVGRQDVPGRPILYGTSKLFLQRFGLRDLRDLPPLKEFQALGNPETLDLPFEATPVEEGANGSMADLSV
ncbi:MAG: SMC-Scp complex subunit ScpB [Nitrospirota bacterium]|nr:MAG: SMC-Scp complex subunit ScpB [Nitrospirota bacterium]